VDRAALADFLRVRREALTPADVGLPDGRRRRTPGLRREEVAMLADMSTDYYARLEQQRGPQPSVAVLLTIARALRLSLDERDHLLRLGGHVPEPRSSRTDHVSPALLRMLDRLHDTPAFVVSDIGDTLAQNPTAVALLGEQTRFTGHARSAYFRWFTDPVERRKYPERDHERQSEIQAAALRAATSAHGDDERTRSMVSELLERSEEFAELWSRHHVRPHPEDHKTLVHPELGEIEVDCQKLFTDNRAQALLVMTATPGTEDAEKLRLLSVLGTDRFSPV
jgi:transcriptional regulator with XRE-family HTH domain